MTAGRRKRWRKPIILVLAAAPLLCVAAAVVSSLNSRGLPAASSVLDRFCDLDKARAAEVTLACCSIAPLGRNRQ